MLLLSTRKGLFIADRGPRGWVVRHHAHRGIPVSFATAAADGTLWAALDHGHWGQKLSRSVDAGATWTEMAAPAYPDWARLGEGGSAGDGAAGGKPAKLEYIWSLCASGNRLYAGTNPGGLFVSEDGGPFVLMAGLWNHPSRVPGWFGGGRDTPGIHSILVDEHDPLRLTVAVSCGGVFLSDDGGLTWRGGNKGLRADFLPNPHAEFGQDPHLVVRCDAHPRVLWQQNHCGIYRSLDAGESWHEVSEIGGYAKFGFAIAADASNPDRAWVVPAISDEMRIADGRLSVCRTVDAGRTWERLQRGLPAEHAYDVVYRHALAVHGERLVFGSTTGNVYWSEDGGDSWSTLGHNFPPVYAARLTPWT